MGPSSSGGTIRPALRRAWKPLQIRGSISPRHERLQVCPRNTEVGWRESCRRDVVAVAEPPGRPELEVVQESGISRRRLMGPFAVAVASSKANWVSLSQLVPGARKMRTRGLAMMGFILGKELLLTRPAARIIMRKLSCKRTHRRPGGGFDRWKIGHPSSRSPPGSVRGSVSHFFLNNP